MQRFNKTWKRELSVALLVGLFYVVFTGDVKMAEVLVWPVFTFAALSFGLDWTGKSGSRLFDATRSSETRGATGEHKRPVRSTEQPDSWHIDRNYYESGQDK